MKINKFITITIVSAIIGGIFGAGISYMLINTSIQKLNSQTFGIESTLNNLIDDVNEKMSQLNESIADIPNDSSYYEAKDWHPAYHLSSSLVSNKTWWNEHKDDTFYLHGNEVRLRWHFSSVNNSRTEPGQLFITLYYSNGTRYSYRYISSIFSSDSADIDLKEPGLYKVEIHDNSTTWGWLVWIYDYY
jgi:hypothetical protein